MPKRYWLFKSEPTEFSIDDLANSPNQTAPWSGVRNYQSRNTLRDLVQVGDEVFFYHSSSEILGIVGTAVVVRSGYPDLTALDRTSPYFDAKSTKENPIWYMVDVRFVDKFPDVIPLSVLRQSKGLEKMTVCQRGSRLSIQPVTEKEWGVIRKLAKRQK